MERRREREENKKKTTKEIKEQIVNRMPKPYRD